MQYGIFRLPNLQIKLLVFLILSGCISTKQDSNNKDSLNAFLWADKTEIYLPITSEWTNRVEVVDINGDGLVDILFANGGNYSEPGKPEASRIFINQGPNTRFKEVTEEILGDSKFLSRVIKVRDISGDNIPDIIIGTTYQTQSQLYLGLGSGKFKNVTPTHLPQIEASIGDIELGDVDLDGDLDMILADWGKGNNMNNSGGITKLWLNNGKGIFTDVTETQMPKIPIQFSWDLEFIDFDNDFDLDIAISCKRCATSRLFVNNGSGIFEDKRLLPAYTNNYDFEVMDINNDGFLDMITINDGDIVNAESSSRKEHIFLNVEGKRFIDATDKLWVSTENIGKDDNNISFLDFDSDGDADFLISSLTGEDRLLINDGQGSFTLRQPVLEGSPTPLTLSLVLADINNDKKLDIIMGQGEGDNGIEERIFMGENLAIDSAPPIISHYKLDEGETTKIYARIHDNKSPNMPQDWQVVEVLTVENSKPIAMSWYGENLWYAEIPKSKNHNPITICATDYAGNKTYKSLE